LSWSGTGQPAAWLDEVKPGTAFDRWLAGQLNAEQLNDPRYFSASADADGDSRPALLEYALQTSPLTASQDRAPVLLRDAADAGLFHFTWSQSSAATGITFSAEGATSLTNWTPLAAESSGADGNDTLMRASFRADGANPVRFVRLRIREQ
jgi:hypothetical protein